MKQRLMALFILGVAVLAGAENYDLIIRNGRIVYGSGNPVFFADLAVRAGRIAATGRVDGQRLKLTPGE